MGDRHGEDWRTGGSAARHGVRSESLFWTSPTIRSLNPKGPVRPAPTPASRDATAPRTPDRPPSPDGTTGDDASR